VLAHLVALRALGLAGLLVAVDEDLMVLVEEAVDVFEGAVGGLEAGKRLALV